jgi:hypothetical protein
VERAAGIEPAQSAWEADVLPLNYARIPYFIQSLVSSEVSVVLHAPAKILHVRCG